MKVLSLTPAFKFAACVVNSDCSIEFTDTFDVMNGDTVQAIIAQTAELRRRFLVLKRDHEITDIVIENVRGSAKWPAPGYLVGLTVQVAAEVFGLDHSHITLGPSTFRWDYLGLMANVKAEGNYNELRKKLCDKLVQVTFGESMLDRHDVGLSEPRVRECVFQAYYHMIQAIPGFKVKQMPPLDAASSSQHK